MSPLSCHRTTVQVAKAAPTLALLPIGACEQHGPHLPLDTDTFFAAWAAERICERVDALLLPALPYGTSAEHRGSAGTMSLRPATLAALVEDIAESCAASGIRRLAILSGHGGNWILRPTVRDINARHPDRTVLVIPERIMWHVPIEDDLHAGALETSIMMHLDPSAVGPIPADFRPDCPREALDALPLSELTPDGMWGHASTATAADGDVVLRALVERVCDYLGDEFADLCQRREAARG
jgi:creatinine amidohydrolase